MKRPLLATAALIVILALPAARAGRLADLPWDDKIPSSIRAGVISAVWKAAEEMQKEKNADGKQFVWVYTNDGVAVLDGKPTTNVTVQRCLGDKMVTEKWRWTLSPKGREYEIVKRDKLASVDDALVTTLPTPESAKPIKPFTFQHDQLSLKMDSGVYVVSTTGPKPTRLRIAGKGHVTITPLNELTTLSFDYWLKTKTIDTDIDQLEITFKPTNDTFSRLVGVGEAPPAGAAGVTPELQSSLRDMLEEARSRREQLGGTAAPYAYNNPEWPEFAGDYTLRMHTDAHGWLVYNVSPSQQMGVGIEWEKSNLSLRAGARDREQLASYEVPEVRAKPPAEYAAHRGFRDAVGMRFDGQFDIDKDQFVGIVDAEFRLLRDSLDLTFSLGGNAKVRTLRTAGGDELLVVPMPDSTEKLYGFGDTPVVHNFRAVLPQPLKAGDIVRMHIEYESPRGKLRTGNMVEMISDGFWYIQRGGFLPFMGAFEEPAGIHLVMRTPKDYTHLAAGVLLSEEDDGDYHYSEWGAPRQLNFPTMIIGKYYPPVTKTEGGVKITGYVTKSGAFEDLANPAEKMMDQINRAAAGMLFYQKLYGMNYPFKDLRLIETPAQGFSAQSPTSMVYIGSQIFYTEAELASRLKNFDPLWVQSVTVHELAHQWYGGRVSNINFKSYWWVESLTELSAMLCMEALKDDTVVEHMIEYWRTSGMNQDYQGPVWASFNRYLKGPMTINMLREYFDKAKVMTFLRAVIQQDNANLISTYDLKQLADRVFGQDMGWFFDQYIENVGIPEVKYQFNSPVAAEDGKGWIITGKLAQSVKFNGKAIPGKVFKNLLVPIVVDTASGPVTVKEYLNEASKDLRMRVEAKPSGTPKIDPKKMMWLTTSEL